MHIEKNDKADIYIYIFFKSRLAFDALFVS